MYMELHPAGTRWFVWCQSGVQRAITSGALDMQACAVLA